MKVEKRIYSSQLTLLLLATLLLFNGVLAYKCPDDFDENCMFCNQEAECLYCKAGYYLNDTGAAQRCFPCSEGCEKCFGPSYCTLCREEAGYFMDSNQCLQCSPGCQSCTDAAKCDRCYPEYIPLQDKCPLLRTQLYVIMSCAAIVIIMLVACIIIQQKKLANDDPNYTRLQGANPSSNSFSKTKTFSFNVLDEDAKRDLTKISDIDTIGKISPHTAARVGHLGGQLSFIEPKTDASAITADGKIKRHKIESFLDN